MDILNGSWKCPVLQLEATTKRLKEAPPDHCVASLQEELISVKMREAEVSLSLKEMRQRLADLEGQWKNYIHVRCFENGIDNKDIKQLQQPQLNTTKGRLAKLTASLMGNNDANESGSSLDDNDNGISTKFLEDQLMGLRIREADTVAELKEMRQKVMELETQNHVCTNQLRRQDRTLHNLTEERDIFDRREREVQSELKEKKRLLEETESRLQELTTLARLKDCDAKQQIDLLRNSISQADLRKAEKWTHAQLRGGSVCEIDDDLSSLPGSRSSRSNVSVDTGSEVDDPNCQLMTCDLIVATEEEAGDETPNESESTRRDDS